jgi:type II secretion system protein D
VATTIRSLYAATGGGAGAGAAASTAVTVSVDERLNAVVATAGETDLKRIDELVRQLDTETLSKVTEIRVFTLVNADATEMATTLTAVLTQKLAGPVALSPNRQMIYQQITKTKEGKDLVVSGLHEGLLISPDKRTNSLVVAAPVDSMPLLEAIIRNMDSTAPRAAEIRSFQLQNADATQMATVLMSLFGLTTATAATGNPRATSYTLVTTQPSGGDSSVTVNAGTAEQYALRVTVDTRTNTLLIGGTKQYVDLCQKVIEDLDASPMQDRVTQVYRLRNTRATDIQTAIKTFVDQERTTITSILGANATGAVQRMLDQEIAVVAVASEGIAANGNTLLLTASPRYFKMLSDMIQELDQPPPQVLVQVLLADVTLTDETDLGMEWSYTKTHGDETYSTGTNFGVAGSFAKSGGFDVSITGSQVSFFLQALQSSDRLEVLSRPQILATDNQTAHIQIGQSVPYVTNSSISTVNNNIVNTVAYKDVGVILDVTPRISPDGLVKLLVSPQVSSVSNSTVPLSSGVNAAIFNTITSTTTITVQDGHTIILGGLITTNDEDTVKKIPVLGDMPWLGNLFRSTVKTRNRHELLIILTPRIINNIATGDAVTRGERKSLKLIEARERDVTKDTVFTQLEQLAPSAKGAATQPSLKEQLIPELKDSPAPAPSSAPAPGGLDEGEGYE